MELREYWYVIRRRLLIVLFLPIAAALVSGYYVLHKAPIYMVSETLLLNAPSLTNGQQTDTTTYVGILQSTYFANHINGPGKPQVSLKDLNNISYSFNGSLMTMTMNSTQPQFPTYLLHTIGSAVASDGLIPGVSGATVINPAASVPAPSRLKRDVGLAAVMAFIAGIGLAFLREYLDLRFQDEQDIVRYLNIPALGSIAEYNVGDKR